MEQTGRADERCPDVAANIEDDESIAVFKRVWRAGRLRRSDCERSFRRCIRRKRGRSFRTGLSSNFASNFGGDFACLTRGLRHFLWFSRFCGSRHRAAGLRGHAAVKYIDHAHADRIDQHCIALDDGVFEKLRRVLVTRGFIRQGQ
jgi:hypothetical protein